MAAPLYIAAVAIHTRVLMDVIEGEKLWPRKKELITVGRSNDVTGAKWWWARHGLVNIYTHGSLVYIGLHICYILYVCYIALVDWCIYDINTQQAFNPIFGDRVYRDREGGVFLTLVLPMSPIRTIPPPSNSYGIKSKNIFVQVLRGVYTLIVNMPILAVKTYLYNTAQCRVYIIRTRQCICMYT